MSSPGAGTCLSLKISLYRRVKLVKVVGESKAFDAISM